MSTELTYSRVVELLPAYVLGALEPEEMLAVDAFIEHDPTLQARVRALEETASQLAHAAPDAPLPAGAREELLARVRADLAGHAARDGAHITQELPAATDAPAAPDRARTTQPLPVQPPPPRAAPVDWLTRVQNWLAGLRSQALIGAALALLVIAFYVGSIQTQLNQLTQQLNTMHELVAGLQARDQEHQQVLALLADRDVVLAGTTIAPAGANASFYVHGNKGVLVVRGLQPLPATKTYQFWLVIDGTPRPFGVFQAQQDHPAVLSVPLPPDAMDFAAADVSIEPAGGSQQVTKDAVVLRGSAS